MYGSRHHALEAAVESGARKLAEGRQAEAAAQLEQEALAAQEREERQRILYGGSGYDASLARPAGAGAPSEAAPRRRTLSREAAGAPATFITTQCVCKLGSPSRVVW